MSKNSIKIAVDAMSGDLGSVEVVKAVQKFTEQFPDVLLTVVGKENELESLKNIKNVEILDAQDVIEMTDSVLKIRRKKEASLFKAVQLVKEDKVDGVVSCGATGPYYALAMWNIQRIEAIMGSVYASAVQNKKNPTVGLLNNGTEEKKGNELRKATYPLLKETNLNFIGNVEGTDLFAGRSDVVVTDGFTGNIALKTIEGTGKSILKLLKGTFKSSLKNKIAAAIIMKDIKAMAGKLDSRSVGGAMMIGFDHPVVKAHGNSDELAFFNAMILTKNIIEQDVCAKMTDQIKEQLKIEG